jgi:reductive dehalogenase
MVILLAWIATLFLIAQAFVGFTFFVSSIWEKEKRATIYGGIQLVGMVALAILSVYLTQVGFFETQVGFWLLVGGLFAGLAAFLFLFVLKIGANPKAELGTAGYITGEVTRYDEREQVFARNRALRPGSEQYEWFYETHPEFQQFDDRRRKKGGPIGHPGRIDRPHEGPNVAATLASLAIPHHLSTPEKVKPAPHPHLKDKKADLSPEDATKRIKGYTKHLGAEMVGVAKINPNWVYSHVGEIFNQNWEDWGQEIDTGHEYAIVFALEMDFEMVGPAPHTPTTIESMRKYADGAFISVQLANYIANLGYSATANHLRHYEVMLVPLAVDAGLGELSRMGYLITKEYGPRIRLGAVTTNLPLAPDKPVDIGVDDFCEVCKKCATACPSRSIPLDEKVVVNGSLRWKINDQTCFDYWGHTGTDCNICMRVCPWSHDRTLPHRLIVESTTRNKFARRIFTVMDDIFYGRNPKAKVGPDWAHFME